MASPYFCFITISAEYWARVSVMNSAPCTLARHLLVRPPLVRDLVGGDVVRVVDVLGIAVVDLGDEADRLVNGIVFGNDCANPPAREKRGNSMMRTIWC